MIAYYPNENELEYSVQDCDNENIKAVANALREAGFVLSSQRYFVRKNGGDPYFVIPKIFAKEKPEESETMNMWIDVSHEYTVTAQYFYHTHFDNPQDAVNTLADFYNEKLAEYLVITPNHTIVFAHMAKENWEDALKIFAENNQMVSSVFKQVAPAIPVGSHHCHSYRYDAGLPLKDIVVAVENNSPVAGRDVYFVSVIFGKQPEFYFSN